MEIEVFVKKWFYVNFVLKRLFYEAVNNYDFISSFVKCSQVCIGSLPWDSSAVYITNLCLILCTA